MAKIRSFMSLLARVGGHSPFPQVGNVTHQTTLTTYTRRTREIKWEELPRIFQDAITITRRVGLRHVWIDSLCIVQDDIKDWQEQSAQMASIYAGSFITIAATSSNDSDSTRLSYTNRAEISAPLNSHQIFAKKQIKHEHMFNLRMSDVAYPVFSRAWRLVLPRETSCDPNPSLHGAGNCLRMPNWLSMRM
jgi:hypothetical protein